MEEKEEKLGERLKDYRNKKGLTQQQTAQALGVTRQAVTKWESGDSLPTTANLIALSKLYGVPLNELTDTPQKAENEEPQSGETPFWTVEKQAFIVFIVGALFLFVYFAAAQFFSSPPSMTLFVVVELFLFSVLTVITFISDARSKTKSGLFDIFTPLAFVLAVQIAIGLICEL